MILRSLLLAFSALAAEDSSLSGKWQVLTSAAGRDGKQDCTITQQNSELTGSCTNERGTVEIKGKVTGANVTWSYKGDSEGGPVTVVFKGKVNSAQKLSGTITAVEFGVDGEFTATRQ